MHTELDTRQREEAEAKVVDSNEKEAPLLLHNSTETLVYLVVVAEKSAGTTTSYSNWHPHYDLVH